MKTIHTTTLLGFLASALMLNAQLSTNIGVTSNYIFRGMSFSADDAAVYGGADYAHESGAYVGTWLSTIMNNDYELDLYAGYAGKVGSLDYDVGLLGFLYPNSDDLDYLEIYGSLSASMFTVGGYYTVSSDVDDTTADVETYQKGDFYLYGSITKELPKSIGEGYSVTGTIGHWFWDDDGEGGTDLDFTHFQVDLAKDAGDYGTFTLSYSVATSEITAASDGVTDTDPRIFVSWGKEF